MSASRLRSTVRRSTRRTRRSCSRSWLRTGTLDTNTAHTVVCNLAAITTGLGDAVNSSLYWDGGHAVNYDLPDLFAWVKKLTGYSAA